MSRRTIVKAKYEDQPHMIILDSASGIEINLPFGLGLTLVLKDKEEVFKLVHCLLTSAFMDDKDDLCRFLWNLGLEYRENE